MIKNKVQKLIINNCPAFYKINLYNKIADTEEIYVVFLGLSKEVVSTGDLRQHCRFPYSLLHHEQVEGRNKIKSFYKLLRLSRKLKPAKIIYGGYINPELIALSYLTPVRKNILQTESATETKLTGMNYFIKKIILKRYSAAVASGTVHSEALRSMGFKKKIVVSGGVGLINRSPKGIRNRNSVPKFLYIGRLIELKNLVLLISVFNRNGLPLTVVGAGGLENKLREMAEANISFEGFIENNRLGMYYETHEVLVLPSLSEAWGLVVEEALYHGCTLLLSRNVGSAEDLLAASGAGVTFDPESEEDLQLGIEKILDQLETYLKNAEAFDLDEKDRRQVAAYLN